MMNAPRVGRPTSPMESRPATDWRWLRRAMQRIFLTLVAEAGAGTADGEQEQAAREDRAGADPCAAVGGRADRPGPRGGPGFEQGVLAEEHVSHGERPGEQAAGDQRAGQSEAGETDDVSCQHCEAAVQVLAGRA